MERRKEVKLKPLFLFRGPTGQCIYVSQQENETFFETCRLFIGPLEEMKRVRVNFARYMVVIGTFLIRTPQGNLEVLPYPVGGSWNGFQLQELKLDEHTIDENDNIVKITKQEVSVGGV